jgi:hypothetical protein
VRSPDTTAEAHARQLDAYRAMTPETRVSIAVAMSEDVAVIAESGIRSRHPDYDEATVRWAMRRLRLGDTTYRAVWPEAPLVDP